MFTIMMNMKGGERMNHTIAKRREEIIRRLDRLQEVWKSAKDEKEANQIGNKMFRYESELDALDMEMADPAAHGYGYE